MSHQLVVVAGPDKGRKFPLQVGETIQVGRSQTTLTRLTDPAISRVHCEIEVGADRAAVHARSSKGTFVNGQPVEHHPLKNGDIIRIGGTELQYLGDSEGTTMEPTPAQKPAAAAVLAKPLTSLV